MSVTVLTGPPGAGKTTVASVLARSSTLGVHLVADQCFHWIVSGYVAPWLEESGRQNSTVIDVLGTASARYAAGGYDVVVDGIVGPWFLDRFLRASGTAPPALSYVILRPARGVALRRAVDRNRDEHLVDERTVAAMYDVFEDLGVFEAHVVDSSGQHPTETTDEIRKGIEAGRFALTKSHRGDMARFARRYA